MRVLAVSWEWYRSRRWWGKFLIGAPIILTLITGLYILARGVQYATAGGSAVEYLPAETNLVFGVTDLKGEWARIQSTDAWQTWKRKISKDRGVRGEINELLKASGLPTLDQLDDERFQRDSGGMYSEEMILRLAGRDFVAACRVGDTLEKSNYVTATRVRFGDYLLLPFARLAAGFAGGEHEDVGGFAGFKLKMGGRDLHVVIDGAFVVAGSDKGLVGEAMRKRGKRPPVARPFWIRVDFETSPLLMKWRKVFRGFPQGGALVFINSDTAHTMLVGAAISGRALMIDLTLDGSTVVGEAPNPEHLRFAPESASGFQLGASGAAEVYAWFKALIEPLAKPTPNEAYIRNMAADIVRELTTHGIERDFLPRVRAPMGVILGSETDASIQKTYTSLALIFTSDQPNQAIEGMKAVFDRILRGDPSKQGPDRPTFDVFETDPETGVQWLPIRGDPFHIKGYLTPCLASVGNAVILANNFDFARKLIRSVRGEDSGFADNALYRGAPRRMKEAGFDPPLSGGDVAGAFLDYARLRDGIEGHLEKIATDAVDRSVPDLPRRVRQELEAAERRQGRPPSTEELDNLVRREIERRHEEANEAMHRSLRWMDYIRWMAVGARATGPSVSIRLMIELR